MCLPDYRYSLFVIGFLCFVRSEDLPSYNVEGQCGYTLSGTQTAGVIHFDGLTYSTDCLITVAPQKLDTGPGRVMLYFTEFDLPYPCLSINVTVLDGYDPSYVAPIKGLPNALCGRNTTLTKTGMVFNTTGSLFGLLIRRNVYDVPATGSFVLKFSSFNDGPCPDLDSITTCKSGRCSPSQFHCHEEIDTCGWTEEEVCHIETDTVFETVGQIVKNILIFIAFVVAVIVLCRFISAVKDNDSFRRLKDTIRRGLSNIGSFLSSMRSFRSSPATSRTTARNHIEQVYIENTSSVAISTSSSSEREISTRRTRNQEIDSTVLPPSYDDLETGHPQAYSNRVSVSSTRSDIANPHSFDMDEIPEAPPSYDAIDHGQSAPPLFPDDPPPSYDDYMSNEHNIYKKDSDI